MTDDNLILHYIKRALAYVVDCIISFGLLSLALMFISTILSTFNKPIQFEGWIGVFTTLLICIINLSIFLILVSLPLMYFSLRDSTKSRFPSIGKRALNLIVINLQTNQPIDGKTALKRFVLSILFSWLFFIDFIGLFFGNHKQKISDILLKVQVFDKNNHKSFKPSQSPTK